MTDHNRVMVIKQPWASVLMTVLAAGLLSAFSFAWNTNAKDERQDERISTLEKPNVSSRLDKLEEKVTSVQTTMNRVEQKLDNALDNNVRTGRRP